MAGSDLGDSIIRLSTSMKLAATDYFAPYDAGLLDVDNLDLGSSGVLLMPDSAGSAAHPHLLVSGSKSGTVYLLDRDNLGHFHPGADEQIVQSLIGAVGPIFGIPAYFNNTVYFSAAHDQVKAFAMHNGLLSTLPVSASTETFTELGTVPSISANGAQNGILWTIDQSAELHAYAAADLSRQLYQASVGSYVKFSTPTVANGKVYAGTLDSLVVFGLKDQAPASVAAVVSAANFKSGPVAAGSIISIFGSNLAPSGTEFASPPPWPKSEAGTSVFFNGLAAPLLYVSATQINAQVPSETPPGQAVVTVVAGGQVVPGVGLEVSAGVK
jgi:outer membrane protein assembly factor BamB